MYLTVSDLCQIVNVILNAVTVILAGMAYVISLNKKK